MQQTVTLQFTIEQIQILDKALGEMPFRVVSPLINEINKQIAEQQPRPDNVAQLPVAVPDVAPAAVAEAG